MNSPDFAASLLARLRELPAADREVILRACEHDPDFVSRLARESLTPRATDALGIEAGAATQSSEATPAREAVWALEAALSVTDTEHSGARIGPYKLLQRIGVGGFGVVWMAEQQEPIKRRVALKIIKGGMDTEEVIARFEAERQALALMEHPNIARVFDAGATEAGRPFFVMELVRGVALTRYCDESRLAAADRLRLFITVCHAVQHAHQKGVIHRDLKPSNILVTLHDGIAVPKIIDFGIAKATSGRLTEKTLFTQFQTFLGTPAYTSPEQMEMSGLDVDTRSDIYSLGVLLYELLTGQPPFDSKALVQSGLEAMRRTIREIDPPRPSHCLGTLSAINRTSVAHQRSTEPAKLSLLLRGDLDWIAMRCLEKDRTRRYESAASLAADLERHLRDDLVDARPPTRTYRTRKFIRRHKVGALAAAAVTASLITGIVASSALFVRERAAHERALSAEKKESDLRRRAEADGAGEIRRAARSAVELANGNLDGSSAALVAATETRLYPDLLASQFLAASRVADGLAYLVHAARKDPANTTLGPRLASALATHNFLLPEGAAFACGSPVLAVHYSKDGRSIYVGTEDGALRIFDAASGKLDDLMLLGKAVLLGGWEFPRANDSVVMVRFTDRTFGVYNLRSRQPHGPPQMFDPRTWQDARTTDRGRGAGISPDGRWVYALARDRFWVWDARTGHVILQPDFEQDDPIGSCDFTLDGGQLAVTVGKSVRRWTLPEGRPVEPRIDASAPRQFSGRTSIPPDHPLATLRMVSFSPDGRLVAVSGRAAHIMLFDATTGTRVGAQLKMPGLILEHTTVVFASNTRIFAAGRRASGSWDLATAAFTPLPIARDAELVSAAFDGTGSRILTTAADGSASISDLVAGELVAEPAGRQAGVCAALAPDGRHVVTGNADGTVQRYRIGGGAARPLEWLRRLPTAVSFLPGSPTRVLSMETTRARVVDPASGRELAGGFAYPSSVLSQPWAMNHPPIRSDNRFVVASTHQGLQAWELGSEGVSHVAHLQGSPPGAARVWFSSRGDLVARGVDLHQIGVWSLRTGAVAGPIFSVPPGGRISAVQFSPQYGRLALGTADGASMVIDVTTALPTVTFATRGMVRVHTLVFSPDGAQLVTVNDANEIRVWNTSTGVLIRAMRNDAEMTVKGLTVSPDGRWFATWGVHGVRLWDAGTGAAVGKTIPVWDSAARFGEDGRTVGTVDGHGSVRVWEVPSGQPFTEPMRHGFGVRELLEFSPDGRFVRVQDPAKFFIWSLPPRLPEGTPIPDWLLRLATILAGRTVNASGEVVDVPGAMSQFHAIRREVAALPALAPLAEWGRWILDDRAERSIAPGFTLTAAEAEELAAMERAAEP